MSCPKARSWKGLKTLCRYLKGVPRIVQKIKFDVEDSGVLEIFVDSDWAGCPRTQKSTNGGCIMWNGACLKAWSTTQTVVAMSSGEAEYYAAVKGAAEGLAIQSMCRDLGEEMKIKIYTDSSACKGVCNRAGVGRIRHMEVPLLWLQGKVRRGDVTLAKVAGVDNPADLMTKFLAGWGVRLNLGRLGFEAEGGRSSVIDGP